MEDSLPKHGNILKVDNKENIHSNGRQKSDMQDTNLELCDFDIGE